VKKIIIPTAQMVVETNKFICERDGNPHHCYDVGKVESALHSAFYPGSYPFAAGGLARVAGALCFYLVKSHAFIDGNKRTGALAAITFLNTNGWDISYSVDTATGQDALAEIVEDCAASKASKDQVMEWFDLHKVEIE
jgi:death-on-curing protein